MRVLRAMDVQVDADGKAVDAGFREVKPRLQGLQQSYAGQEPSEAVDSITGLSKLSDLTDKLRRSVIAVPKVVRDPVDVQLESIREHLEQFRRRAEKDYE